jgi:fucose permease
VPLTLAALALTSAGFLALWLSGQPTLAVSGLLVAGLGVANLYPLTLALALGAAAGQTDRATARVQLLVGLAVIAAPLALGSLADRAGVARAFALVPALIGLAPLLLLAGRRSRRVAAD